MHIPDGVLSGEIVVATSVLAAAGVGRGLYRLDFERVPRIGVLASVFFVGSLIHVSVGPTSVHLLLVGLLGLLLGWGAFPALAAAFLLQAVLFGHGGLTSLGANVVNSGAAAVLCWYLFADRCRTAGTRAHAFGWGAAAGAAGVVLAALFTAACLVLSSAESYRVAVRALLIMHVPVAVAEAVVVGGTAAFLHAVRPDLLQGPAGCSSVGPDVRRPRVPKPET